MAQSSGRGGVFNASQLVKAMNYSTPHKVRFENFTVDTWIEHVESYKITLHKHSSFYIERIDKRHFTAEYYTLCNTLCNSNKKKFNSN